MFYDVEGRRGHKGVLVYGPRDSTLLTGPVSLDSVFRRWYEYYLGYVSLNLTNLLLVNAVIFLCPMAHFDTTLPENSSVNTVVSNHAKTRWSINSDGFGRSILSICGSSYARTSC